MIISTSRIALIFSTALILWGGESAFATNYTNTVSNGGTINLGDSAIVTNPTTSINGNITDNGSLVFWQSGTLTDTNLISGTGYITQAGTGTTILGASNTYSGGTGIGGGVLSVSSLADGSSSSVGTTYVALYGGTLSYTGLGSQTTTRALWIDYNGGGSLSGGTFDIANAGASLTWNPGSGAINYNLTKTGAGTFTLGGVISSNAALAVNGGTMNLRAANTSSGAVTVNGGILNVTGSGQLFSNFNNSFANAVTIQKGGELQIDNWGWSGSLGNLYYDASAFVLNGGTLTYQGTTANGNANRGFTVGTNGATFNAASAGQTWVLGRASGTPTYLSAFNGSSTLTGVGNGQMDQYITGSGSLTKNGSGTWTLTGVNTYTGGTIVNAGTLGITQNSGITNNLVINSGGTVSLSAQDNTLWGVTTNTINSGGILTQSASNATHMNAVVLNGGTIASQGSPTGSALYWGSFILDKGVTTLGSSNTSVISAQNVALTQTGGTVFNIASGATNGIDLLFSGTIGAPAGEVGYMTSLIKTGNGVMQLTGNNTYTNGTIISGGALQIGNGGTSGTLGSGAVTDNGTLILNRSDSVTIGNVISGSGNLVHSGSGTTVVTAVNPYSGSTTISSGTLAIAYGGSLYSNWSTSVLTITNGGVLQVGSWGDSKIGSSGGGLWNNFQASDLILAGGTVRYTATSADSGNTDRGFTIGTGGATLDAEGGSNTFTLTTGRGFGITANNNNLTLTGTNNGSLGLAFGGSGSLTKNGSGTWTLSTQNTQSGGTVVNQGTMVLNDAANNGTGVIRGNLTVNSNATVILTNGGSALGFSTGAQITNLVVNQGSVIAYGEQHLFMQPGQPTGNVTLNGGTLQANGGVSSPSATSWWEWGNFNVNVLSNAASSVISGMLRVRGDSSGSIAFNVAQGATNGTDMLVSAAITELYGSSGISKAGNGTMLLSGSNAYSGATTVAGGTLRAGSLQAFGNNSAVTLSNTPGVVLDLNGYNNSLGSMAGGGSVTLGSATLTSGANNSSTTYSGVISGTGGLVKTGAGAMTLSGANTFTGTTAVNAGTLVLSNTSGPALYNGGAGTISMNNTYGSTIYGIQFGAANQLGSNVAVSFDGNGTWNYFQLFGNNQTIGSLIGSNSAYGVIQNTDTTTAGSSTLTVNQTTNGTFAGYLRNNWSGGGTLALVKNGAATLTLSGANISYSGGTVVNAGSLVLKGGSFESGIVHGTATVNNGGNLVVDYSAGAYPVASTDTINVNGGGTLTLSGGGPSITNAYVGTVALNSSNGVSAMVASQDASGLRFGRQSASLLSSTGSAINTYAAGMVLVSGGYAPSISVASNNTLNVSGTVSDLSGYGGVSLTKSGAGTLIFSGTNSYAGSTIVSGGTLRAGSTQAFGIGSAVALSNASGVSLDLNGYNNTIDALNGGGAAGGNVTLGGGTLTVGGANGSGTFSGTVSGTGGFAKSGSGVEILTGANTYSGTTVVSAGTLQVGTGGTSGSLGSGAVTDNATLTFNRSDAITVGNVITGTGTFVQNGSGTTILTGSNTYSGTTTVSSGTLQVGNGSSSTARAGTGALSVGANTLSLNLNGNAALGNSSVSSAGLIQNIGTGKVTLANGSITGTIDGGNGGIVLSNLITSDFSIKGDVSFGSSDANRTIGASAPGATARIVNAGSFWWIGSVTASNALNLDIASGVTVSLNASQAAGNLYYNNLSGSGSMTYNGNGTGYILGTSTLGGTLTAGNRDISFGNGGVTGSAGATRIVANSTVAFNSTTDNTYSGMMSGAGALVKNASNVLTLTGSNTYSGGTTISAGTLQVGNGGTNGTLGSGNVTDNATLVFNRSDSYVVSNVVSGSGVIVQNGSGTTILTGANNNSGNTVINSGTLQVGNGGTNGALGSGNITNNASLVYNFSSAAGSSYTVGSGSLTQAGTGTFTVYQTNTYTGGTYITQGGTIAIGSTGALTGTTNINLGTTNSRGTFDVSAKGASGYTFGTNQSLSGNGTITTGATNRTVTVNGALKPGNSIGTLAVNGNLTLGSTAQSMFELGTAGTFASPGLSDRTTVTGNLALGGSLSLLDNAGANGQGTMGPGVYRLFTYGGSLSGNFTNTPPSLIYNNTLYRPSLVTATLGVVDLDIAQLAVGSFFTNALALSYHVTNSGTVSATLGISNTVAAGGGSLGVSLVSNSGSSSIVGATNFSNLAPSSSTNMTISVAKSATAGVTSGTAVFAMNDTGVGGANPPVSLGSNSISYTSTGYNLASASLATTNFDLGRIHAGGIFGTTNLTISNTAPVSAYSETLGAGFGAASGGVTGSGSLTGLTAGSSDNGLSVTLNDTTSGAKSGTIAVALTSQEVGNSGLGNTSLGSQTISISGFVYTGQGVWATNVGSWGTYDNWQANGGTPGLDGALSANDTATFGSGGSGTVTLDGASPSLQSLTFSNKASSYEIAQGIGGSLTLQAGNTNATINVQAGSHSITAPLTFGSDVKVTGSSNTALSLGPISGVGGLTQSGSGTTILSAANSYGGNTAVSSGTLVISGGGTVASPTTTISGGTLVNNGVIAGTTTLQSGGTLAGNGGSFSNLTIQGGALVWNINNMTGFAGTGWDQLSATNLDLSGLSSSNTLTIKIVGTTGTMDPALALYSFNFLSVSGTLGSIATNGFLFDTTELLTSDLLYATNGVWSVTQDLSNGGLDLTYAVPEPSTYALLGLGALAFLIAARRRRA